MTVSPVDEAIARTHREEWARVVASLARRFGDLDLAEEAAADAWVAAVERWPRDGIPPNPGGWLTTTATRRAIDRLRRESRRDVKQEAAYRLVDDSPPVTTGAVEDDRLRLVFTCCHPALATEARVALTLRLIGGLTVSKVAVYPIAVLAGSRNAGLAREFVDLVTGTEGQQVLADAGFGKP